MVAHVLERDRRTHVFHEFSSLSSKSPDGLRLDPMSDVIRTVQSTKAPIVVAKPLVESQRIRPILDSFEHGCAVWIHRAVDDVVSSNLERWGDDNGDRDLQPILDADPNNWRSESASPQTIEMVRARTRQPMQRHDAAALFWLARNQLFFDQDLGSDRRVLAISYEDLTGEPRRGFDRILGLLGSSGPPDRALSIVSADSVGKGRVAEVSSDIRAMCDQMRERLLAAGVADGPASGRR